MKPDKMIFTEKSLFAFYHDMDTVRSLFMDSDNIYYLLEKNKRYSIKAKLKQILKSTRLNIKMLGFNTKQKRNVVFDEMEIETINIFLSLNDIDYTVKINIGLRGDITIAIGIKFADAEAC